MKKCFAICGTAILFTTLGLAQGTSRPSNDNPTQYEEAPRHDYGWIGLLGLLGLGGLMRRRETADRSATEPRSIDNRRVA
jgi:MYXO-CTERM domain-containing protein